MTENYSLKLERTIKAPIAKVFDAWLDPALVAQWMAIGPSRSADATIDPVVGGKFRIVMHNGANEIPHDGEYRVIDRPNRLSFTWSSPFAGTDTLVTIDLTSLGDRETRIALTHERFATADARDKHNGGWNPILDSLKTHMENGGV